MQSEKIAGEAAEKHLEGFSCLCECDEFGRPIQICGRCQHIAELTPIIRQAITSATSELSKEVEGLKAVNAEMLNTLHMAYQFCVDTVSEKLGSKWRRLTDKEERELGRRLAQYWDIKPLTPNTTKL